MNNSPAVSALPLGSLSSRESLCGGRVAPKDRPRIVSDLANTDTNRADWR